MTDPTPTPNLDALHDAAVRCPSRYLTTCGDSRSCRCGLDTLLTALTTERQRREEAERERDDAVAQVDALLSRNGDRIVAALQRTCLRCRKPFERELDVYRCVDCGAELHRECARAHFGDRVWPPAQACAVGAALRDERSRAEQAESALTASQAECARLREALEEMVTKYGGYPGDDAEARAVAYSLLRLAKAALAPKPEDQR